MSQVDNNGHRPILSLDRYLKNSRNFLSLINFFRLLMAINRGLYIISWSIRNCATSSSLGSARGRESSFASWTLLLLRIVWSTSMKCLYPSDIWFSGLWWRGRSALGSTASGTPSSVSTHEPLRAVLYYEFMTTVEYNPYYCYIPPCL